MNITDKQVIEHVSKKSKNPHAAMMVEWLLTGKEVLYRGCKVTNPSWLPDNKYEFKSKQKPAYRVYIDPNKITLTIDRYTDGTYSSELPEDCIWLSDWVEYDTEQAKQWPSELVERISKINLEAAEWLRDNWDDIKKECRDAKRLDCLMIWYSKPQGNKYWQEISKQLGE